MSLPPGSPRLPSPPPPTEIQIGPKSPSLGDAATTQESLIEQSIIDSNSRRRIHPGTKAADMAAGPPLVPLMELDSAFQLQEHLKALHYHHTRPSASHTVPINRHTASLIANPPFGVDRALWLYELCRFLINKCNDLIVGFLFDSPPCSASTCPEMRASEWQFLCAVHETPKSCCAIDYCCHTLDWATNIVTSQKIFPSRLSLGSGDVMDDKSAGVKHLTNIFRRLHRIFAHAWFQHRGVFWQVEGQTGLYVLFKTVCDNYELLPAENYKLPPEAEGLEPAVEQRATHTILKSDGALPSNLSSIGEDDLNFMGVNHTNTRRHIRSSPSTGAAIMTVPEADEDESDMAHRLRALQIKEQEAKHEKEEAKEEAKEDAKEEAKEETKEEAKEVANEEAQIHDTETSGSGILNPVEELSEMTIVIDDDADKVRKTESKQEDEDKGDEDDSQSSTEVLPKEESTDGEANAPEAPRELEVQCEDEDSGKERPVHTLNLDEELPTDEEESKPTS